MRHEPVPSKPGYAVAAAAWQFDHARKCYRLRQVCYEPRKRKEREAEPPPVTRRQGLLL